jgi:hypothetical protein
MNQEGAGWRFISVLRDEIPSYIDVPVETMQDTIR